MYSIIGSGILASFASGYLTYLGVLNPIFLGVLSFMILAASIVQFCVSLFFLYFFRLLFFYDCQFIIFKDKKLFFTYYKKQTQRSSKISAFIFYAIATLSGGSIGLTFNLLDNKADFLEFSKIVITAFTYSFALFAIFTVFTIISKKRLVKI